MSREIELKIDVSNGPIKGELIIVSSNSSLSVSLPGQKFQTFRVDRVSFWVSGKCTFSNTLRNFIKYAAQVLRRNAIAGEKTGQSAV